MVSAREANQQKLVNVMSKDIDMKMPEWARHVKTGVSRERQPEQANWYQLRCASVLRKIYMDGPVGVSKLRSYYGGRKNNGHQPSHFEKGSGKILRTVLQQLEEKELVKKTENKKGRVITPKGQKFVDQAAKQAK